ncbi:BaiN/RdsA family NAD(P)/FAD-dependent oxidoreductase [Vallitalea okinawensis]|uniref:NAD(P)/FAD-dependent oxidoreductase n=1 Tax=Vallitalea okinawensis TaxID=2078660 RepID=UPI000CFBE15C|nr:NAD(P)/FAD-dependent oxidoreductase [Vallitalea okinawensis]
MSKVIVVGGGASGLMAAIIAAREGASVVLLEKLSRVGKKILATGNGRCNISNRFADSQYYHGKNKKFILSAFNQFTVDKTINFFEEIGVHIKEESSGKLYPYSDQASSVLDLLRYELGRLQIEEICDAEVTKINRNKKGFKISTKDNKTFYSDKVIVAVGGKAAPNLGTNGAYDLVERLGHHKTNIFPALVQIRLEADFLKALKGVKLIGCCRVLSNGKCLREEQGEILFTDYGISGPPILQLSRKVGESIDKKESTHLSVDMIPEYTHEELRDLLLFRYHNMPNKTVEESLQGLMNKRLCRVLVKVANIDLQKKCSELSKKERERLIKVIKELTLKATGTQSWMNAQVTAGGILTNEVNPSTLESKYVKGLYLTGEILDIDGDCGGFNLQWAWSSGYVAGLNAAR